MAKKKKKDVDPKVHDELKGFKMEINSFGEISSSFPIDKINEFLNKNVEDKKLKDRDDLNEPKTGKKTKS
jgi:hypothetical protein